MKTIHRIMVGEDKRRVSDGAAELMAELAADIIEEITNNAAGLVNHSGRTNMKAKDVRLAHKQWIERWGV